MNDRDLTVGGKKYRAKSIKIVYENRLNMFCLLIKITGHRYMNRIEKSGLQAALFVDQYDQFTSVFVH